MLGRGVTGASAIYELWHAVTADRPVPPWGGIALRVMIFAMLAETVLAVGSAVFSAPLRTTRAGGVRAWVIQSSPG